MVGVEAGHRIGARVGIALLAAVIALLALVGTASAATIAAAPLVLVDGPTVAGAVKDAQSPAYYAIDLQLAQRVEVTIDSPMATDITARLFRPGVDDATLSATTPRNVVALAKGVNAKTFAADWPGRWILEVAGPTPAPYSVSVKGISPGTPGKVAGATSVSMANGMIAGTTYVSTTLDPENPTSTTGRIAWVQASAGDRVTIQATSTNGKPLVLEAFRPDVTDATIESETPVASVTTTTAATLAFNADEDGQWIVRAAPAADDNGITKPATFTALLNGVVPRDPATTCVDDVTDIGLVRVSGCVTTGRNSVSATGPISFSGVDFIPATSAPIRIDPKTLEVSSTGDFSVDMLGMRVLPATRYFLFKNSRTFEVPDATDLWGVPITGSLKASWSLEDGGTLSLDGTAKLPMLGVDGRLAVTITGDSGIRGLHIGVGVEYLYGISFTGALTYRNEVSGGQMINVWRGDLSMSFGVAKPSWLTSKETTGASTESDPLAPDTAAPSSDAKGSALPASLVGAAGALEFRDGRLAFLRGAVNTKIPIGQTGMFVTQLGAALRWDPYFMIAGNGTISLGPDVNGISALAIAGHVGWASAGSCPGSTQSSPNWFGGGSATIAGWFSIVALDACFQQADTPYIVVSGTTGFGVANVLTGTARLDGYVYGTKALMLEGTADMNVWGVGVDGRVVISDAGYAACGAAYIDIFGMRRRMEVGAEGRWADGAAKTAFACPDFAPYLTVPLARSMRTDGVPITVPKGVDQVDIVVKGGSGVVPGIDIVGPDGTVVAQSASTSAPTLTGAVFAPRTSDGAMQIALPVLTAGTYLIRVQAGGSIASVETSLPRATPVVKARIVRSGGVRTLRYTATGLDGRRVRFAVTGRGVGRLLATTGKSTGALRIGSTGTVRGVRRVTAEIIDERGFAQAPVVVARYVVRG